MSSLMQLLHKKDPALFKKTLSFTNKTDVLNIIKETDYFCFPETFFGRTRQFTGSYVCEHPFYNGYHLIFDLKHDVEKMFAEKSLQVLKKTLFTSGLYSIKFITYFIFLLIKQPLWLNSNLFHHY